MENSSIAGWLIIIGKSKLEVDDLGKLTAYSQWKILLIKVDDDWG